MHEPSHHGFFSRTPIKVLKIAKFCAPSKCRQNTRQEPNNEICLKYDCIFQIHLKSYFRLREEKSISVPTLSHNWLLLGCSCHSSSHAMMVWLQF